MPTKSLDAKLADILSNPSSKAFIIADAKDADMALGLAAPGETLDCSTEVPCTRLRTLQEYRELMRENVRQGLVDIMLMSASSSEVLTLEERLFDESPVTPAVRMNDTTDIWWPQGGAYPSHPSRPFRSATIDHAQCGKVTCVPEERTLGVDLGLYSITLNNDPDLDLATLRAYADFRHEAETKGFRHFLEVFDPNAPRVPIQDIGRFMNDSIARILAGVVGKSRPLFLKVACHGPAAMEALCSYDNRLVVGILGGASGTTYDAFHQLWEAKRHGARVALYGRMINHSEHQPTFIQHLRWLADGDIDDPAEAVRAYHGALDAIAIRPRRPLEHDLLQTRDFGLRER